MISIRSILPELQFSTSRSSGPGGQNVNKVNTKVIIHFDVRNSAALSSDQKLILLQKLESRLTNEGVLVLASQDKRSQLQNKEAVLEKLERILRKAFEVKRVRKATKPTRSSAEKRIKKKKLHGDKKKLRQRPE